LIGENVILARDFNLTLNSCEVWGEVERLNLLENLFSEFFEDLKLVDVEPHKVVPTWIN
jgi:hypothetical protein